MLHQWKMWNSPSERQKDLLNHVKPQPINLPELLIAIIYTLETNYKVVSVDLTNISRNIWTELKPGPGAALASDPRGHPIFGKVSAHVQKSRENARKHVDVNKLL